jgi:hypothetical protein
MMTTRTIREKVVPLKVADTIRLDDEEFFALVPAVYRLAGTPMSLEDYEALSNLANKEAHARGFLNYHHAHNMIVPEQTPRDPRGMQTC